VAEYARLPWCERCEWNLSAPDLDPLLSRTERWRANLVHGVAYDMTRGLYANLAGRSAERPRRGGAYFVLLLISAVVVAVFAAAVVMGVLLVVTGTVLLKVAGVLLLAFSVVFRPQLGSARKVRRNLDELTEDQAPHLFRLVRQVADAVGAPMPHVIGLNSDFNAMAGTMGLTRRRILVLGLPLLAVLRPQERVALLGHEVGHFINRDSRRSFSTKPALTAFGTAAQLLDPRGLTKMAHGGGLAGMFAWLGSLLLTPVLYLASHLLWLCHLGVNMVGARVSQRAEYYADDLAARAAGSEAAASMMDCFVDPAGLQTVIGTRSRNRETADGWRAGVEQTRTVRSERMHRLRQLSIRTETGIFRPHPPAGLRHRLLLSAPYRTPGVVLTAAESAAIDGELSAYEEKYRMEIAPAW
jgi:Zn-dependent protease with chaperone function